MLVLELVVRVRDRFRVRVRVMVRNAMAHGNEKVRVWNRWARQKSGWLWQCSWIHRCIDILAFTIRTDGDLLWGHWFVQITWRSSVFMAWLLAEHRFEKILFRRILWKCCIIYDTNGIIFTWQPAIRNCRLQLRSAAHIATCITLIVNFAGGCSPQSSELGERSTSSLDSREVNHWRSHCTF